MCSGIQHRHLFTDEKGLGPVKENRRHPRFSVDFLNIHGKILFSNDVKVLNISAGGIAFVTEKQLNTGGVYVLRLENKGRILHLRGKIVWSTQQAGTAKEGEVPQAFTVGMKFQNISDTRTREIEKFIRDNYLDYQPVGAGAPLRDGIRIHVRFTIHDPERATVRCVENYTVKRLSKCGMLIESDFGLPAEEMVPMEMTLSKNHAIALWGRIVTCRPAEIMTPPRYEIGIEFMDMSETDMSTLDKFVSSLDKNMGN
jgi:c-di-GMP-binding flagellar brake protein YcgR